MKKWTWVALLGAMAFGCGDDDTPAMDAGPADTGAVEMDAGADDAGPPSDAGVDPDTNNGLSCAFSAPYGATVGATMAPIGLADDENPFELQTCDGNGFSFPDQATCDAKLTILSIAAGWCGPCIQESANFERVINDMYDPADVRLLQIIIQDEGFNPPTPEYCRGWVNRFGLSNTEVIDPAQLTQAFFPDNSLPSTVIINNSGEILHRENGISDPDLSSLRNTIDGLLRDL